MIKEGLLRGIYVFVVEPLNRFLRLADSKQRYNSIAPARNADINCALIISEHRDSQNIMQSGSNLRYMPINWQTDACYSAYFSYCMYWGQHSAVTSFEANTRHHRQREYSRGSKATEKLLIIRFIQLYICKIHSRCISYL